METTEQTRVKGWLGAAIVLVSGAVLSAVGCVGGERVGGPADQDGGVGGSAGGGDWVVRDGAVAQTGGTSGMGMGGGGGVSGMSGGTSGQVGYGGTSGYVGVGGTSGYVGVGGTPTTCPEGQVLCGFYCASLDTPSNCGACGNTCGPGAECVGGVCVCQAGLENCSGACANLQSDSTNCGACGNACVTNQSCVAGVCTCPSGATLCGNTCAVLSSDQQHCGACNNACVSPETCVSGECACPTGQQKCDGVCVDTTSNNDHCGACSSPCQVRQTCAGGVCEDHPCFPYEDMSGMQVNDIGTAAACYRTDSSIGGWGCWNDQGRTILVNDEPVSCGGSLPSQHNGYYYFEFSAGDNPSFGFNFWL